VIYTYLGYGIAIWLLIRMRALFRVSPKSISTDPDRIPTIAFIVAAYNEEHVLAEKLKNSLELEYPADKIRIVIVTDGSTDGTAQVAAGFPSIVHLHQTERRGKVAAVNRAVADSGEVDVLVFSDANTVLNKEALIRLVKHYNNQATGAVSGEKRVIDQRGSGVRGESFYWRYESVLKKLDAEFYTLVGAAGEIFSVRKSLYEPVPEEVILDDFYISLKVCEKGFQVKYEPAAFTFELPSVTIHDEAERKARISAGAFQAMIYFAHLMNPFHNAKLSFQYLSRRVFRWVVCPLALPVILLLNLYFFTSKTDPVPLFSIMLSMQVVFYFLALLGWVLAGTEAGKNKVIHIPYYFLFMNMSVWYGFFRFINGRQSAIWEKVKRPAEGT
jgi:poly-beta-1,6-N-acetyl-D-glucosamine synthase